MYSKYFLHLIYVSLFLPRLLGASSFHFDRKMKRFYTTKSSRRRVILVTLFFIALTFFFCGRTLQIFLTGGGATNTSFHISYGFCNLVVLENIVLLYMNYKQDDFCILVTRAVRYFINFEREWMENYNPSKSLTGLGLDLMLASGTIFVAVAPWSTVIHYLYFPTTPIFIPTVFPPEWRSHDPNGVIYWAYALVTTYYAYCLWQTLWVTTLFCLLYIFSVLPLINCEFRVGAKGQKSKRLLRTVWNLPVEYRAVQLLHQFAIEITGKAVVVFQGGFSQVILFCNVSVIRYQSKLDLPTKVLLVLWSLVFQGLWMTLLELSGRFHEHSKKTLRTWKNMKFETKDEKKYMSRFRKTCRPLTFGAPGIQSIKRLSVLKFLRAIIKGTFRALIIGKGS